MSDDRRRGEDAEGEGGQGGVPSVRQHGRISRQTQAAALRRNVL